MPFLRQSVFLLAEPPGDLKPEEEVYQVRFTKEIFRDYEEFAKRMHLYRQKIWTCKATGRSNLTYEKALISECRASQKVDFPKDFMGPVLHMVQFSELEIDELVEKIYMSFEDKYVIGEEVSITRGDAVFRCKILEVCRPEGADETEGFSYQIGWLDCDGKVSEKTIETMVRKSPPFTKTVLKKFIQESAIGDLDMPWLVRDKLARKFKIPFEPPEEKKRKREPLAEQTSAESLDSEGYSTRKSGKRYRDGSSSAKRARREPRKYAGYVSEFTTSKYPIDDQLLEPESNDSIRVERPAPCCDFPVANESVGRLLMAWDFCNSFSRVLQLSQFCLDDLEKALNYMEGDAMLNHKLSQKRKKKVNTSLATWKDDLCDYFEAEGPEKLRSYMEFIRNDNYWQLPASSKLEIFEELIEKALNSKLIRSQLEENIEEHQTITAQKRDEGLWGSAKKKGSATPKNGKSRAAAYVENGDEDDDVSHCKRGVCLHENGCLIGWLKKGKRKLNGINANSQENGTKRESYSERALIYNSARQTFYRCGIYMDEKAKKKDKNKIEERCTKKMEHLDRELERCFIRTSPLGKDRDYNRYWFFPREGRVFVESEDSSQWGFYAAKKELDVLYDSLNAKGIRERGLQEQLETSLTKISSSMQRRGREMSQRLGLEEANVRRSVRVKSTPRPTGFLAYVNKSRNV